MQKKEAQNGPLRKFISFVIFFATLEMIYCFHRCVFTPSHCLLHRKYSCTILLHFLWHSLAYLCTPPSKIRNPTTRATCVSPFAWASNENFIAMMCERKFSDFLWSLKWQRQPAFNLIFQLYFSRFSLDLRYFEI